MLIHVFSIWTGLKFCCMVKTSPCPKGQMLDSSKLREFADVTILNLLQMAESFPKGKKVLWEKVKLFIMSNFSFSHSVFKRLVLQICKDTGLFGKRLTVDQKTKCKICPR